MQRVIMKSKIHRATVTRADVVFELSCGITQHRVGEQAVIA
jgi:aspartate 1-decarboxylase